MIHYFVKIWIKFLLVESTPNMSDFTVYIAATLGVSVLLFYCIERPAQQKMRLAVTNMLAPLPRTALSP
jgi:peptidoglycan/LPS O-acetylase OafA/YrhL